MTSEPEFCKHIEMVVLSAPDAEAIMNRRRELTRLAAQARLSELAEWG